MNFKELIERSLAEKQTNNYESKIHEQLINEEFSDENEDLSYWFNMKNPETGLRYDIPMLDTIDPGYYFKYVYYMKIKDSAPETFEQILKWD